MADLAKLRQYCEALGIAVRAGVLTPSVDDEEYVRKFFDLPPMNAEVLADWKKTGGARSPITIAAEQEAARPNADTPPASDGNGERATDGNEDAE